MGKPCVYLAGPISGESYAGATNWRDAAKRFLDTLGITGVSPMRSKGYLKDGLSISDEYDTVMSCSRGIITRDRFDCMRADVLLVYLICAERVSVGTMIELGWADAQRIPVVLVIEDEGNPHDHAMVREIAGFRVNSLAAGLQVISDILCV